MASALAHHGVTRLYTYHVADRVRDGSLRLVLRHAESTGLPVHLITPNGRLAVPKVRSFVDFAVPLLRAEFARLMAEAEALGGH
jgi:DNA-binding transcriptional LysR family regulator